MKTPITKIGGLGGVLLLLLAGSNAATAANGAWVGGGADGNWTTIGNWISDMAPGVTDGTTVSTDTALFTNNPVQLILTVDANRNLQNFTFDAAAGLFTIGGAGVNLGSPLLLTSGGTAQLTPAISTFGVRAFNAPLIMEGNGGSYTFLDNSTSTLNGSAIGDVFRLSGAINGVATAGNTTTLNLAGSQGGWDSKGHQGSGSGVNAPVTDGPNGGKVGVTKSGTGTWAFTTVNNTYSGPTIVNGGTLVLSYRFNGLTVSASNAFSILNPNTPVTIGGSGGKLQLEIGNSAPFTQQVASVTMNGGQGLFTIARFTSGSGYWNLGSLTRSAGATLDVAKGGSGTYQVAPGTLNSLAVDSGNVPYLTAESFADWAGYNTTTTLNSGSYTKTATTASTLSGSAEVASAVTLTTLAANTSITSFRDNINQATTINLGGFTLNNAGYLITSAVNTPGSAITSGTLMGAAGRDLVFVQNSAQPFTVGAVISDNGSATAFTKGGNGTLILTGANTYSGVTYINSGTNGTIGGALQLGNGGTSGSIANSSVVTNSANLVFNRSDAITFPQLITGIGGVTNAGSGAVTLTANNTYAGNTVITAGASLKLGSGGNSGTISNSAAIVDNGTLTVNLTGSVGYAGVISGGGSVVNQGGGTTILGGNDTYSGNTLVQAGTLALGPNAFITNSTALVISSGAALDVSSQTNFTLNGTLLPNGQILAGSGTVTGAVVAAGASVITPGTNGVVGTLTLSSNLTINGATLELDVANSSKDQLVVGGSLYLQAGSIGILTSGSITNGTYRLINYTGSLAGDIGNLTVSFSGVNQIAVLNTNTPNWITLVVSSAIPNNLAWQGTDGTNPSWWDVQTTLNWTNGSTPSAFAQNDNVRFDDTASTFTVDLRSAVTPTKVVVNSAVNNYTFQTSLAGKISGGASLVKSNSSALTLLTTNDYSGVTVIANGTLQVGNGSVGARLGSGNITDNAILIYDSPDSQIVGNNIAGSGSLTVQAGQVILSGNNSSTGTVTNYSGATLQLGLNGPAGGLGSGSVDNEGSLILDRSDAPAINNLISGAGSITNSGSGTVTIGGANTYSGATVVNNGTLKIGNASALGSALLEMDGGASAAGILDLNGFDLVLGSLVGATGAVLPQIVNNGGVSTNILTVNSPANSTFPGLIADNTGSGGKITLVDIGPNTLTLSGANTYSGGTLIENGSLALNNVTAAGSGLITLSNATVSIGAAIVNTINVQAGTTNTLVGVNVNASIAFVLTNSGVLNVNPPGSGNFSLIAVWPNFSGNIILASGGIGVRLPAPSSGAAKATWDLGQGVGNIYTRDGGTIDLGSLAGGTSTILSGATTTSTTIYRLGGANVNTIFSGTINNGSAGGSPLTTAITKIGSGIQTLDGTLNYSGTTAVSAGELVIGSVNNQFASLDNSTNLVVSSNAVLDVSARADGTLNVGGSLAQALTGSGTINGSLVTGSAGATINPGDTIGTLSVTNTVDLEANSTVNFQWNRSSAQTSDKIAATNSITVNGGALVVTNLGTDLVTGDVFRLFNQAIVGSGFTTISLPVSNLLNTIQYVYQTNLTVNGSITVLQGASAVAMNPPQLTNSVVGGVLTFSWPADHLGWVLEAQTNSLAKGLGTNWARIPGTAGVTTTNFPVNPANSAVFYRLIYP